VQSEPEGQAAPDGADLDGDRGPVHGQDQGAGFGELPDVGDGDDGQARGASAADLSSPRVDP